MNQKFAVLYKTFTWNEFDKRQLTRIEAICTTGDIFIFKDQTKKFDPVDSVHKVFHGLESHCTFLGLAEQPQGKLFWYNVDYPLYYFFSNYPEYDYYIMIEYDVYSSVSFDSIIDMMTEQKIDCIAHPITKPDADWDWNLTGAGIYPENMESLKALYCFAAFSRAAVSHLLERRRLHSAQLRRREISNWPLNELFIPTELHLAGFTTRPLQDFGDVSRYNWWPPTHEQALTQAPTHAFIHPLLEEPRYILSCVRWTSNMVDYFDPASILWQRLRCCSREIVVPIVLQELRQRGDHALINRLKAEIASENHERLGAFENIAAGKPSTQSSISEWSIGADPAQDARRGNNGVITGDLGFHTAAEDQPWWVVDLLKVHRIVEIRLHNRLANAYRTRWLSLWTSITMEEWQLLARRTDDSDFGGADGNPYIVMPETPVEARFLRIKLDHWGILHLDEVQVFGEPV